MKKWPEWGLNLRRGFVLASLTGHFHQVVQMQGTENSSDVKKIVLAWPYEVAFEDGTKWKCGK